jgi:hypothetical protein
MNYIIIHYNMSTVNCKWFHYKLHYWWGYVRRLQPAGPKRQAKGAPGGLRTPGAWLPSLGAWQATPAGVMDTWPLGWCLGVGHITYTHVTLGSCLNASHTTWRLGSVSVLAKPLRSRGAWTACLGARHNPEHTLCLGCAGCDSCLRPTWGHLTLG